MATLNKFNCFAPDLMKKVHNLDTDVLKVLLSNTVPVATDTVTASITQITAGNGYTADGNTLDPATGRVSDAAGVAKLTLTDEVVTATGGSIGPFQYVVLVNATANRLIGWYNYGSAVTLTVGQTLTLDFDATNGVLTI